MELLTTSGRVMAYLLEHPDATNRSIAIGVGITERTVMKTIASLELSGYVEKERDGRRTSRLIHCSPSERRLLGLAKVGA